MSDENTTESLPPLVKPGTDGPPATWEQIFEHPRFKALATEKQALTAKLSEIEAERAAIEKDKLAKAAEWEKLYGLVEAEKAALQAQIESLRVAETTRRKRDALRAAALAHDPPFSEAAADDAHLFIELDKLDDNPQAAAKAVKLLAQQRGYMLAAAKRSDHGSPPVKGSVGSTTDADKKAKAYQVRI